MNQATLPQNTLRSAPVAVTHRENTVRIQPIVRLTPIQRIGRFVAECHPGMTEPERLAAYEFCGKLTLRWALAVTLLALWVLSA